MRKGRLVLVAGGVGAVVATLLWWHRNPSACPYSFSFSLELPHPFVTRSRLRGILAPAPGERMLEVGPGTGYYSIDAARWVEPDGALDVLDVQQEMLDLTVRRAHQSDISNIVPTRGDARELPYPDGSFDGAFLVATLGEVPDKDAALRELRRVLRPGGRLVVGEVLLDPHMVTLGELRERAEAAGLRFELRLGGRLGYYARFSA